MNLIYTVAIGNDHVRYARFMVQSLRTFGKFDGDILVFSDHAHNIDGATVVQQLDILALRKPHMTKAFIGKALDVSAYNKVCWLDADVVAVQPVAPLFEQAGLWLPVEVKVLQEEDKQAFSIPAEPCAIGDIGLNAGLILHDGVEWNGFCQRWWDAMVIGQCWNHQYCFDQPVLNHLIRSGIIPANRMPEGTMHFLHPLAQPFTDITVFVHARAPLKHEIMRMVMGMMSCAHS